MNTLLRPGDRICLVAMHGTVVEVARQVSGKDGWFQIEVSWDNGRTLMLVSPPDVFEIVAGGN